jgi:cyclin B
VSKFSSEQKNLKSKKEDKSENIDNIDMEIDSEYKESPKNSIDLNYKDESHIEESKLRNNSYKNCDLSFGDNYSTANSNVDVEKKIHLEISEKNNEEYYLNEKEEQEKEKRTLNENKYLNDIFENLIGIERSNKSKINPNYFIDQIEVNHKMRTILIDWLVEVHYKLKFKEETFYTAIYIIDAYLSKKIIQRFNLQLLGITSLFIASKLYEIFGGNIQDYSLFTNKAYNVKQIINMEIDICDILGFNFLIPTAISFYQIITKKEGLDKDEYKYKFGEFLIQSFLLSVESLKYNYSIISYSSIYLVKNLFKLNNVNNDSNQNFGFIENISEYNAYIIKECSKNICQTISELIRLKIKSTIIKYTCENFEEDLLKLINMYKY